MTAPEDRETTSATKPAAVSSAPAAPRAPDITRRAAVARLAVLPLAVGLPWTIAQQLRAQQHVQAARSGAAAGEPYDPKFFTPEEYATVVLLSEMVIPRDDRSGSAVDAGVPEFTDFIMLEFPQQQHWMRTGLAWLEAQTRARFGNGFVDAAVAEREAILDEIAWPGRARAEMRDGVLFFNRFRDLAASGFWSSRMGVEDLDYRGNTIVTEWKGCPPEALAKLGVSYQS